MAFINHHFRIYLIFFFVYVFPTRIETHLKNTNSNQWAQLASNSDELISSSQHSKASTPSSVTQQQLVERNIVIRGLKLNLLYYTYLSL